MRPVYKRPSPIQEDFTDYKDAQPHLISRLGKYCSYCERPILTLLAVEHIQPKDASKYPHLMGSWDNFLLGCVNCNSTKGSKDVVLSQVLLPDRDNTFVAYHYRKDGVIEVTAGLNKTVGAMAKRTLNLTGLDKPISEVKDENGKLVALDRVAQRMEAWLQAEEAKQDLEAAPSDALRRCVVNLARATGFFSIWMKVFEGDTVMRQKFVEGFEGTAKDCFDAATNPVSPRPHGHNLTSGSKI